MDLSAVIDALQTGTYTVTRPAASSYTAGVLDTPGTSTLTITACVQTATGRDLKRLPEGRRTDELKAVFTATQLHTQESGQGADLISIDGDMYEVQTVERWDTSGAYFKALALKAGDL